ncbi:MAG: hypothetical protein U1E14_08020 [Geminicoccaceae bacterium]
MAICTADGTRYIPVPDDSPAAPVHDPHDLCGLCCVSCARGGLAQRIATLVPPPAIVSDQAWPLPENGLAAAAVPEHRRPPGRAPPPVLV